jgi:hypothetical protein
MIIVALLFDGAGFLLVRREAPQGTTMLGAAAA